MGPITRALFRPVPQEWLAYICVPLVGWWWLSTVTRQISFYGSGVAEPSVADFLVTGIILAWWFGNLRKAWGFASGRLGWSGLKLPSRAA